MQLTFVFLIIAFFLLIIWLMGTVFLNILKKDTEDALLIGFFIYFSLFEIIAFPLIMMLKPLSLLVYVWSVVIFILCMGFALFLFRKRYILHEKKSYMRCHPLATKILMIVLLLIQTYYMIINSQNGWDAASYISNVVQAVDTDTMYVYMEGNGLKSPNIYVRYAISSFYMHDAVLAKISGVHAAIICRWFNSFICSIISAYTIFKIGVVLFKKKEVAYNMVNAWIIANFGVSTMYFANTFFMTRAYEGKAFCCNIIIPAVIYAFLKIYKNPVEKVNWLLLFFVNMASVAISSSSLAVVPVLNGCLFVGHFITEKRMKDIGKMVICILPSVLYFLIYALCQYGSFKVKIP